jgi:hypothetical protein
MMKKGDDFAFPGTLFFDGIPSSSNEGMTLRDWFAGQIIAGISGACFAASGYVSDAPRQTTLAKIAYGLANAMLVERAK